MHPVEDLHHHTVSQNIKKVAIIKVTQWIRLHILKRLINGLLIVLRIFIFIVLFCLFLGHNIQGTPQKDSMSNSEKLQQRSTWQTRSSLAARSGPNSGPIIMGRDGLLMGQSGTTGTYSGTTGNIISDFNKPNVAVPICGCLFLVTIYIFSGAAVIAKAQNWAYFDAMYYCFISLSTIGFGGIRLEEDSTLWVCALYLLFGMTILSTCCHILHQEVRIWKLKHKYVLWANIWKEIWNLNQTNCCCLPLLFSIF